MERKASAMYPLGFSRTIISVVMSLNPTIPNIGMDVERSSDTRSWILSFSASRR